MRWTQAQISLLLVAVGACFMTVSSASALVFSDKETADLTRGMSVDCSRGSSRTGCLPTAAEEGDNEDIVARDDAPAAAAGSRTSSSLLGARWRRVNDDVSQCIQSYCGGSESPKHRIQCIVKYCHRSRAFWQGQVYHQQGQGQGQGYVTVIMRKLYHSIRDALGTLLGL